MDFKIFLKIIKRIISVALCIFAVFAGVNTAIMYLEPVIKNQSVTEVEKVVDGRVNILLLATDKGGLLTDTIMLASVDTKRSVLNVMSIPRDTRVTIGRSQNNKINAVYASAKEGQRVDAVLSKVKELTGLPINYYAVVNPGGFAKIIDILGGVYIDVPQRMKYSDPDQGLYIDLYPGYQLLDGDKSEQFCRFRSYPTGDLGRIEAQQNFVKALYEQKLNADLIAKAPELFSEIEKNLKTNVALYNFTDLLPILNTLSKDSIRMYEMPNNPLYIGTASYVICDVPKTKELIRTEFLGIKTEQEKEAEQKK